jgi:hypothetical protein
LNLPVDIKSTPRNLKIYHWNFIPLIDFQFTPLISKSQ